MNHTDTRWAAYGADLGHMFLYKGTMVMVFGDTFGQPAADPFFSVPHSDWRSNTMALVDPTSRPSTGLLFSSMINDRPRHAQELLSSLKVDGGEKTVIPTYGVSTGSRMFLYYMSVRQYDQPGHWTINYSGVAYSDNAGQTWTKDMRTTWPGTSNFGQVSLLPEGTYIYVYGIPGGRYGGLQLARVPTTAVLDRTAYQYWNGSSWVTNNPEAATDIVPAPVGELSVQYNSHYKKWLMMYLIDPTGEVVLRMADSPIGPWGPAQVVVTTAKYPQAYAPYLTPLWLDQKNIYFTMSLYGSYQVFLMHTSLNAA